MFVTRANRKRAQAARLLAIVQHPDGDLIVPVGMDLIRLIVFDQAEIERRLRESGVDVSEWGSKSWRKDHSFLIEQTDGVYILYCQTAGPQRTLVDPGNGKECHAQKT